MWLNDDYSHFMTRHKSGTSIHSDNKITYNDSITLIFEPIYIKVRFNRNINLSFAFKTPFKKS